ncbi:hypothetical protein [Nonomuraea aridisoli]|uniref:hypothetical protein n=1 Tax=Nonomuraea aridisoli TaxID=2070368 RepID=UPI0015E894E0|nr:hypothetical protein [Nonomuraea aridisoli]
MMTGNLGQARKLYQQAIETGDPGAAAQALKGWGDLEVSAGDLERARQLYKQILGIK